MYCTVLSTVLSSQCHMSSMGTCFHSWFLLDSDAWFAVFWGGPMSRWALYAKHERPLTVSVFFEKEKVRSEIDYRV